MRGRFAQKKLGREAGGRAARQSTILICYDGERTEHDYFTGWKRALGTKGAVVTPYFVKSGGNALDAVRETIKIRDADADHEECWCVCDVDDTSANDLQNAKSLASSESIKLCLSQRCFEIWIRLHWPNISTAPLRTESDARKLVAQVHPDYLRGKKTIPFSILYDRTEEAIKNAKWLAQQGHKNPATTVHLLVTRLLSLLK